MIRDCSKVEAEYERRKKMTLDINEHLETLFSLALKCSHITEFGVREGHSTVALAAGKPEILCSYDIKEPDAAFVDMIRACVPAYQFHQDSTLDVVIKPTNLLLIDTYHTYDQLSQELDRHADKVWNYIVLHDTETFGEQGEDGSTPGLMAAVEELMAKGEWVNMTHYTNNNGLTVLERR